MLPRIPTRTDAYIRCNCDGTMIIQTVAPIPDKPDFMLNTYQCVDCGALAPFEVAKLGVDKDSQKQQP